MSNLDDLVMVSSLLEVCPSWPEWSVTGDRAKLVTCSGESQVNFLDLKAYGLRRIAAC
jgi:hypothetical protein